MSKEHIANMRSETTQISKYVVAVLGGGAQAPELSESPRRVFEGARMTELLNPPPPKKKKKKKKKKNHQSPPTTKKRLSSWNRSWLI